MRRAAFEHLGSFIATFYVSLGSEDEQSSINPFSDSILLDNSLLPAHEEDGIWVGGAEDNKTSPIAQSERGGSGSGTGTGESGMGNVPGDKEEEEPFFLFMDTPISWGRKEGKDKDKEKGGEDSAVEERGGEREEGERKGEVLALELNTESDSLKNKCSPTPVERLTEENVSSSGEEESLENERVSSQPVERLELDLREGALIGVDNLGSNAEAEEKVVEGAGEVNAANSEGHVGEGETREKGVEEKPEVDEEEREGVLLLEQSQDKEDNGNEEETETKTDEAHSSTKGEKGGGGNDKEEGEREEEEGKEEKAEIQTVEGEEEEKEQREVDSESPKQSTVAAEEENSTCEKKEAPTGQEEAENEGSTGQEEAENEAPTGEEEAENEGSTGQEEAENEAPTGQEETENEAPTVEKEGSGGCGVREGGCGEEEELAAPPHVDCSGGVREGEDEVPGSETNVSSDSETGSDVSSGQGREEDGGGREEGEGVREGGESIPEPCEEGETPESQGVQSAEDTATQNKFPPVR